MTKTECIKDFDDIVNQTKRWLEEVIIGLNFCPFAKKEFVNNTIEYFVTNSTKFDVALSQLLEQFEKLDSNKNIETTLVIFSQGFTLFYQYLDLVDYANQLLIDEGYEGIYQLASFHPDYFFDGEEPSNASHYTNRSPYPTIHIIREASMEKVLAHYPEPEKIPEKNIALAKQKGTDYFKNMLKRIKNNQ